MMMQKIFCRPRMAAAPSSVLRRLATSSHKTCSSRNKPEESEEPLADQIEREVSQTAYATSLTDMESMREPMPSVMKEIFVGRFPQQILSYPDVLPKDRHLGLEERVRNARQTLRGKQEAVDAIAAEGKVPKDLLLALRSQGFYGLNVPKSEGGEGLTVTETCRLMEELSVEMSLSETVATAAGIGYKAVELYGTEEFKAEHLEKFVQGTETMALCMADSGAGSDASSASTHAYPSEEGGYKISGKKLWVTNADSADFFTVIANVIPSANALGTVQPQLTAFAVPKTAPGVTVLADERHSTVGLKGLRCTPVELKGVTVGPENLLGLEGQGFEILTAVLAHDRVVTCARISAALRGLLSSTVRHALARKTFGKKLLEFDLIQQKLGDAAAHLYALESMVYMTAGIADTQVDMDFNLEAAACKRFAVRAIKVVSDNCLSVLGSRAYLDDDPHRMCVNDLMAYSLWDSTDEILSMYIAVSGIGLAGANYGENVRKVRNPLVNPFDAIKNSIWARQEQNRSPGRKQNFKRTLELSDYVHTTLYSEGNILEYYVHKVSAMVYKHLIDEGANASAREIELSRLSDCAVTVYAMASTIARASRAISEGYEHFQFEVPLAQTFVACSEKAMDIDLADLEGNKLVVKHDHLYADVTNYMKEKGRYPATHAMAKFNY